MQVLLPQGAGPGQIGMNEETGDGPHPVLYLLHGWSDDDTTWMRRTSIERYAMEAGFAVVMPRVELSYYQNMASGMRFYEFLAEELPRLCCRWFPIRKDRAGTFAAGLSMGGYGAFRLGLSRPDAYAAVASLSGALDLRDTRRLFADRPAKMAAIFGAKGEEVPLGERDLFSLLEQRVQSGQALPKLWQWCGTEDFLYEQNRAFREKADRLGVDLKYSECAGDHSWGHWDREIQPVLRWMRGMLRSTST